MNNIIISSTVADLAGSVRFKFDPTKTEIFSLGRRVSRRPTLDGGSVIDDYGYTDSDRTFTIVARLPGTMIDAVNYVLKTFSTIVISTVDGLYFGSFQSTKVKGSEVTMKILIKEKMTS